MIKLSIFVNINGKRNDFCLHFKARKKSPTKGTYIKRIKNYKPLIAFLNKILLKTKNKYAQ